MIRCRDAACLLLLWLSGCLVVSGEDSSSGKMCLRDKLRDTGTAAFDACTVTVQVESNTQAIAQLQAAQATRYIALVEQEDEHGGEGVLWEPIDYEKAYDELLSHAATVFSHESRYDLQVRASLEQPVEATLKIIDDRTLRDAFSASIQFEFLLQLKVKFETAQPSMSPSPTPTESPTDSPTQSPTDSPTQTPTPQPTMDPTLSPTPKPTSETKKSCKEIKQANPSSTDGVYELVGGVKVYCEMTTDGGGWTVMSYLRGNSQWDWGLFSNNGALGDVNGGFNAGHTLKQLPELKYTEKLIVYKKLWEQGSVLGKQWMINSRSSAVAYSSINTATGWAYRDSFGYAEADAGNVCTHGCSTYRGFGMFKQYSGWSGTQGGNNGCKDGNNICWVDRSLSCNVGSQRCAYLSGSGEGVIYAVR